MKIEKVTIQDTKELLAIYAPYIENSAVSFEYVLPSVEEFQNRIETISAKYPYIKAVDDNHQILGYAYASTFKGRSAYDWSVETTVYVKEDYKRSGIGRLLYDALEKSLKDMGILNMNACIAYPETEDEYLTMDSVHFHEKMGFTPVGIFHNSGYKYDRWYHMIWMEKMIGEHKTPQEPVGFGEWEIQ